MLIFYKNKGILILPILIGSTIATAILNGVLSRNIGGIFSKIDIYSTFGFAFLFAGIVTYLIKDDFYKDRQGNKKKMDTINSFFFIKMQVWALIFLGISLLFFGNLLLHYFN